MKKLLLAILFVLSAPGYAETSPKKLNKLGVNILNLMVLGDFNATFERQLGDKFSMSSSIHFLTGSSVIDIESTGLRLSGGVRAYMGSKLVDQFIEAKLGGNLLSSDLSEESGLTAEFFYGVSQIFNEHIYYEAKAGALRYFTEPKILPAFSMSLGMRF